MIYIRADMNPIIATGHVMRCLAIADAIKDLGEETTFIVADERSVDTIQKRGYQTIVLNTKWDDMESEITTIVDIIRKYDIQKLLIDSYYVTENYLRILRENLYIVYLDDLNIFEYDVDEIVCYANYYYQFKYPEMYKNVKLNLGMRYTPLRREFWDVSPKKIRNNPENLMIMSGGTDPYDMLNKLLHQLDLNLFRTIYVICGIYYNKYDELVTEFENNEKIHILKNVSNMKYYMEEADIAITAAGTTLYELCAVGTPTISYAIADNQLLNAKGFCESGLICYAGDVRKDNVICKIQQLLREIYISYEYRKKVSVLMQQNVDGKGAHRIALCMKTEESI